MKVFFDQEKKSFNIFGLFSSTIYTYLTIFKIKNRLCNKILSHMQGVFHKFWDYASKIETTGAIFSKLWEVVMWSLFTLYTEFRSNRFSCLSTATFCPKLGFHRNANRMRTFDVDVLPRRGKQHSAVRRTFHEQPNAIRRLSIHQRKFAYNTFM